MSSIPDIGDQPIEHDPTGVRALLRALPDPGPMPADLVARIQAALAAEPPFVLVDDAPPRPERSPTVVPFAAADATSDEGILRGQTRQQRRRVVLPWLAAAAAAGIVMVSGTNLLHDRGSSIAAAFGGGSESSAGSAAMPSRASSDGLSTSGAAPLAGKDTASGMVSVQRSGASYTSTGLAAQVRGLTATSPTTLAAPTVDGPTVGPLGTPLGARDCAVKHGVDPTDPLTVDLASIDGTPGIVVVARHSGARTAYAFAMSCEVLAGPVSVP